ncbi:MAG: choice-of-anchor L domain-containing protein [Fluviicola sp.]
MKYISPLIILFFPLTTFSQLITGGSNSTIFASVLSSNTATVSNVNYTGSLSAICYFGANVQNMPFSSGLLMSTGYKNYAAGPNNHPSMGLDNSMPGYAPINSITGASSFNASVLEFDAIPSGDTLKINYIFASEEYPEYVGYQFCDGFAIYISGPGITGVQNIARLPNSAVISVNTVNGGNPGGTGSGVGFSQPVNPAYFVNNGNGNEAPYNSNDTYLQYDGLTVPLTAKSVVTPNQTYHIVIVVADGGDGIYDSAAFIEEGGVTAGTEENGLENTVNVLYNPMTQMATIQLVAQEENLNYSMTDLSGKVLEKAALTETKTVDLSTYSSGMYLICVESRHGIISKKIIR